MSSRPRRATLKSGLMRNLPAPICTLAGIGIKAGAVLSWAWAAATLASTTINSGSEIRMGFIVALIIAGFGRKISYYHNNSTPLRHTTASSGLERSDKINALLPAVSSHALRALWSTRAPPAAPIAVFSPGLPGGESQASACRHRSGLPALRPAERRTQPPALPRELPRPDKPRPDALAAQEPEPQRRH